METNEAKLGIVFGREDATGTCFTISREHYLKSSNSPKKQVILTFSDSDLKQIIDERINFLEYLEFKIFQITAGAPNSTYDYFTANK